MTSGVLASPPPSIVEYLILNNGGHTHQVRVFRDKFELLEIQWIADVDHPSGDVYTRLDDEECDPYQKVLRLSAPYKRILADKDMEIGIARDRDGKILPKGFMCGRCGETGHHMSGCQYPAHDGNTVLIEQLSGKYLYVGTELYTFEALEPISELWSPIGNNAVPYPYAFSETLCYIMEEKIRFPTKLIPEIDSEQDPIFFCYCDDDGLSEEFIAQHTFPTRAYDDNALVEDMITNIFNRIRQVARAVYDLLVRFLL